MTFKLRKMDVQDVPHVRCIEATTSETPWSYQTFVDCIEVGYDCWVHEQEETKNIVSFGLMSVAAGQAHILNIAVDNQYQRNGLGRNMMDNLISIAKDKLAASIYLEVRVSNEPAIKLYDSLGFTKISTRQDYYGTKDGAREDAIVLEFLL